MKVYPESVQVFAENVYKCVEEELQRDFSDSTSRWLKETCIPYISDIGVKKFINGEELVFNSEQEITEFYIRLKVEITISSLIRKGLVDTIENENGEEMIFLTKKGKDLGINLRK